MSSDVIDQFLAIAQQSGLLPADVAKKLTTELQDSGLATQHDVAAKLVEKQAITPFQAEKLLAGLGAECVVTGRYLIQQQLGAGAMGAVYLAEDRKLDRQVAIKVLPAHSVSDANAIARFQREAKALAKLSHPNIIQAYDSDQDANRHFLVMEYAQGTNLADLLKTQGRLAPALAADYIYQAAVGLQNAHEKGLVHRDLKPGNLLVTSSGQVKVLDLGLARFLHDHVGDATLTRAGTGMGTPDYMAPEQFHDAHHVDVRSDIYSLGCTLYHLLTGRVPFPGTSMSEKYAGHEQEEPAPVEELCPEAPAGLALAVRRMMAKRPGDRFQSAREVAEALFPHVLGSSSTILPFKATVSWHGSQMSFTVPRPPRSRRWAPIAAASAMVLVLALFFGWRFLRPQVVTIPNGFTVAKDGTGQFTTIGEALEKVDKPGMTIQVLDNATYNEEFIIGSKTAHEGLTLESMRGAMITVTHEGSTAVLIKGTRSVTLRGFRIRMDRLRSHGVHITGASADALLEKLDFFCNGNPLEAQAITIGGLSVTNEENPITIRRCKITDVTNGIVVLGMYMTDKRPDPCHRIVIKENDISGGFWCIVIGGLITDVQIAGNRVWNCDRGIYIMNLLEGSKNILVANNSVSEARQCILVDQPAVELQSVELLNNLILATRGPDVAFNGADRDLLASWRIEHNWRQLQPWVANDWIPADKDRVGPVKLLSLDPTSSNFLRPPNESPLGTVGIGGDLPEYVGAVPPEGVRAWDWQTTWDRRHPKMLLTVSQDPNDGGEFRSINEALEKVTRPGVTIRVLDNADYHEAIRLTNPQLFDGLTLDSPSHATIVAPAGQRVALLVANVPRVTLRGIKVQSNEPESAQAANVVVTGTSPGTVIDGVEFLGVARQTYGIHIESLNISPSEQPLEVRNCTLTSLKSGIVLKGLDISTRQPLAVQKVIVRGNRIRESNEFGIALLGRLNDVALVENRVGMSGVSDIHVESVLAGSDRILIANNTLQNPRNCLRVVDPISEIRDMQIVNNLFVSDAGPDLEYTGTNPQLLASWHIANNYRQHELPESAEERQRWLPADKDRIGERLVLASANVSSDEFLASPPTADLSTMQSLDGLPEYIGPVPPSRVEPWEWDKTWQHFFPEWPAKP